jgi:hypothetical protein
VNGLTVLHRHFCGVMENVSDTHPSSSYDLLITSSWNRQIRSRVSNNIPTANKVSCSSLFKVKHYRKHHC